MILTQALFEKGVRLLEFRGSDPFFTQSLTTHSFRTQPITLLEPVAAEEFGRRHPALARGLQFQNLHYRLIARTNQEPGGLLRNDHDGSRCDGSGWTHFHARRFG